MMYLGVNQSPNTYESRGRGNMENMTDKQMQVILNLVADKFKNCKDMDEVEKAIKELEEMASKEKTYTD